MQLKFKLGDKVTPDGGTGGIISHRGEDVAGNMYLVRYIADNGETRETWYREQELTEA